MEKKIAILVVDDFATMRKVIRNLLKQLGYENIVEAENGEAALSVLKSRQVDLIISDWNMPTMSGYELLKAVRADGELQKTPFLMVTAEALKENVVQAVKAGVSNYIVKPFTADVIKMKLEQAYKKVAA